MKTQPMHPNEVNTLLDWQPTFTERVHAILDGAAQAAWIRRQRSEPPVGAGMSTTLRVALCTFVGLVILSMMAACGDSTAPIATPGPLAFAIASGNHQTVAAGSGKLTSAVTAQLVRRPNGSLSIVSGHALLDGVTVTGSPVPGAVVCAVSVDADHALTPFVPCTNTGADGKATFFFNTGTKAGSARAEIRGTFNKEPAVFDTAVATVLPDTLATAQVRVASLGARAIGSTVDLTAEIINARDRYSNTVTDFGEIQWTFSTSPIPVPVTTIPTLDSKGTKAVVPKGALALYARLGKVTLFWSLTAQ